MKYQIIEELFLVLLSDNGVMSLQIKLPFFCLSEMQAQVFRLEMLTARICLKYCGNPASPKNTVKY